MGRYRSSLEGDSADPESRSALLLGEPLSDFVSNLGVGKSLLAEYPQFCHPEAERVQSAEATKCRLFLKILIANTLCDNVSARNPLGDL